MSKEVKGNPKGPKIGFYITTGILSILMLMSASMYFINYEMVADTWRNLGFATWLIYPLAIAKILGVIAIWSNKSKTLKEWAYAGYFFDFVIAGFAHYMAGEGIVSTVFPGIMVVVLILSYVFGKKREQLTKG